MSDHETTVENGENSTIHPGPTGFTMDHISKMPPANVRYIKVKKSEGIKLFSEPKRNRINESSSQESAAESSQDSQCSTFSFSQPKKVTKLSLKDKKRPSKSLSKQWTPKKTKGDVIVKVNYPGLKVCYL